MIVILSGVSGVGKTTLAKLLEEHDFVRSVSYTSRKKRENETEFPKCVLCRNVIANASLKTTKLIRHLETNHIEHKDKPSEYFIRKLNVLKATKSNMTTYVATDKKYLKCSFLI